MKTQDELLKTENRAQFIYHPHQQPISRHHVATLYESMKKYGFLPSKPLQVCKQGNQLVVIDGHHRLEAANLLRCPVYYVIESQTHLDLIGVVNRGVRKWSNISFARLYAEKGNPHYIELLEWVDKGIPLPQASSLLRGESAHSGNAGSSLRDGKFTIKTRKIIEWICNVIKFTCDVAPEITKKAYIEALAMCWFVDEFEPSQIVHKIRNTPRGIVRAADRKQALGCLEEVYNFKRSLKINLSFLAFEKMKERGAIGNKR